ncbi:MAG: hypothetical protein CL608_29265 [Anaerolineaceae bacterium]|nr:hypothetical protein [Anaerolineaceae bacterium]
MLPRHVFVLLIFSLGLCACNAQETNPLPTLVPTLDIASSSESERPATATAVPPTLASSPVTYTPVYKTTDCHTLLEGEIGGEVNIECGTVTVPEERLSNAEDTIQLAVVRFLGDDPAANATPIIFLSGGPGSPVLSHIGNYYTQFIAPFAGQRDVIFFDPRGVGLSEPEMDCWGIKLTYLRDMAQTYSDKERSAAYLDSLFHCKERLEEDGVNLAAYHSESMAADVKDILQALGYQKAHLFGVSYGTRVAQQIMQDYPEVVETAVLDSVVPTSTQMVTQTATWPDEARQSLFASCASQPACQARYPDLEAVYQALQTTMRENPIPLTFTDPVLGNEIEIMADPGTLEAAMQWAVPNPYLAPFIPQMLYELRDGDNTLLTTAVGVPLISYQDISLGLMISVLCHDQVSGLTAEQLAIAPEAHPQLSILNTVAAYDNGRFLQEMCQEWGALPAEFIAREPVHSSIPTLILAGQLDTTTPPAFGQHVAESLSQSYYVEIPNQGHVPTFGPAGDCLQETVAAFLNNPQLAPPFSCQIEQTEVEFYVPYDGSQEIALTSYTASDLPYTVMVPADWEPGTYHHFYWLRFSGDVAQIAVQSARVTIADWLDFLEENYVSSGLEKVPEFSEEIMVNGRRWQIYTATFENHPVTFAFFQDTGTTFHVALASTTIEHAALYENLLLPVLDSLTLK